MKNVYYNIVFVFFEIKESRKYRTDYLFSYYFQEIKPPKRA